MFTRNILLPALRKAGGAPLSGVATTTGMSAEHLGRKYGFDYCTSDYRKILEDAATDHVVITTRHHMHGPLVVEALTAGKHVFVEKPLCLSESELRDVVVAYSADRAARLKLMVGFNRRYSGMARRVKEMFKDRVAPLVMTYRVNAGYIPADHWTQDAQTGGGRIVGEVCHFVDLLQFITGSYPVSVFADAVSGSTGKYLKEDNVILTLHFADGSVGSVVYGAAGSKSFSRERIEVFGEDAVAVIEDFKRMILVAGGKRRCVSAFTPDMGYVTELRHFLHGAWTEHRDNFADCVYATLATLKAVESLEKKMPVGIEFNFDPDPAETGDAGAVAAAAPAYIN
jgi:predicted dehydrogenase